MHGNDKKTTKEGDAVCPFLLCVCLPLAILTSVAGIPPQSCIGAAFLSFFALSLSFCTICFMSTRVSSTAQLPKGHAEYAYGRDGWFWNMLVLLLGLLALLLLVTMTVQHHLHGYWWTMFLIWPGVCYSCYWGLGEGVVAAANWKKKLCEAEARVRVRSIVFKGKVVQEKGRACVCSWPGKSLSSTKQRPKPETLKPKP